MKSRVDSVNAARSITVAGKCEGGQAPVAANEGRK